VRRDQSAIQAGRAIRCTRPEALPVIMLLRSAFYESERRCSILEACGLARIYTFRKRLPMMHRDGWQGHKANSSMSFSWFVWQRGYRGDAVSRRISWERSESGIAILRAQGRPKKGEGKGASGTIKRGSNSRAYIIARLRRDGHIELAQQVEMGLLSARAAVRQVHHGAAIWPTDVDAKAAPATSAGLQAISLLKASFTPMK
jgi:hypothetical protein